MRISLAVRMYLAAALTVTSVILYFLYTLVAQQQLAQITHEILDKRIVQTQAADKIKHTLLRDEITLFHYLATRNKDQLIKGEQLGQAALAEIEGLQRLSRNPEVLSRLNLLDNEIRRFFLETRSAIKFSNNSALGRGTDSDQAADWARSQPLARQELDNLSTESDKRLARMNSLCDEIISINQKEIVNSRDQMRVALTLGRRNALWAGFLVCWVVLLLSVSFIRSLLHPLRALLRGIERVEKGDMDFQIPVTSHDEVGRLTLSFNRMTRTVSHQRDDLIRDSITDGLTGLYNQRHFRTILKQEMERAQRTETGISLLMIDIDHFKQYNDTMGHESGNVVLRGVADALRGTLRDIDSLARYGGDEMAVILPDTSAREAKILARRMESAVRGVHLPRKQRVPTTPLTLSIGGASFPQDAQSAAEIILKADQALYFAKRVGRACLRWASDVDYVPKTG